MAITKLSLEDFSSDDYDLIAIHSNLEDYRLAYFVNKYCGISLEKAQRTIDVNTPKGLSHFSLFTFDDQENEYYWSLISNKSSVTETLENSPSLFADSALDIATNVYLIPELKSVDYFLKIDETEGTLSLDSIFRKLANIKQISTVYEVESDTLRSKNNLIF
ncbi:MAG: IPExxxVDY family protein [Flavobacterium sp.]|nr:IPExxxVDY family protein [Candidatus Neoflavobacterium equi]